MEHITMSKKECEQYLVFERLKKGEIKQIEAAAKLGISTRWVRKKLRRYEIFGSQGLVHKNRNRASKNCWNAQEEKFTIDLLKNEWQGFGPTFTADKLQELHQIQVSRETVRKVMKKNGLWKDRKKRINYRHQRQRQTMFGIMVQFDGSEHDWFEGRGPKCTALVFIDDATSRILWIEFALSESYASIMPATKNYVEKFGRPHKFYVDFGKVFSVNLNNPEREKKTQWERAMEELDIEVIHARSPQAKGRVERCNQTLQDRLIKEMRLAGISSPEAANKFVIGFIEKHNQRFAVPAGQSGDAHRSADCYKLDQIFCLKKERILANDYTIVYNKRIFQLEGQQRTIIRPKDIIRVHQNLDGSIQLFIRAIELEFREMRARLQPKEELCFIHKSHKPSKNSKRWVAGLLPLESSRVKPALPAVEAKC